ncbi:HlyD family secretion protein [Microvirga sp. KLBC 81]|uniref:HlyD family secretion protein n=1 Tax=Microvirga sp. KLBC 81 TaxID=1862707 RepID=UPI001FDF83E8|nr:HlyD family efflux transporter periplasmic adaptor subunit [Microvirga sp. KLBC 81]
MTVVLVLLAAAGLGAYAYFQKTAQTVPANIAQANGRIEVQRVDISTKVPGRIASITMREGDMVSEGQVVAMMDETEVRAELAATKAAVERAIQGVAQARATTASREAELALAEVQLKRSTNLLEKDYTSRAEADQRRAARDVAAAAVQAAKAAIGDAEAARKVAEANVAQVEARIADMTLKAPIAGRVEYRLVEPGEVVASGGKVVTLLDLSDVYMTVFLPTASVGQVRLGSEARIVLDAAPDYVIPANVSFVAAEAQFTPKTVETADERAKLMYRVKVSVPIELLRQYRDYVKSGLTGNAYILLGSSGTWPDWLQPRLPDAKS